MTRLLFLDVETTGLNRERDIVLAVGMRLTTVEFEVISEIEVVTPAWAMDSEIWNMAPAAKAMHEHSGLYGLAIKQTSRAATDEYVSAWDRVSQWLDEHVLADLPMAERPRLAGNNVGSFDKPFMCRYVHDFQDRVHYRTVDVSTMHELAKLYAPALLEGCPGKRDVHMPLADIDDAIALFRHLRAGMGLVKEAALCFPSP